MANDELMRLAERVQNLSVREDTDGGTFCAQHEQRKIAADILALAQRAPQNGAVPEEYAERVLSEYVRIQIAEHDERSDKGDRVDAMRRALAAAAPAPEAAHDPCLVLWQAMNEAEKVGLRTDDKLIVQQLRRSGYFIAARPQVLSPEAERAKGEAACYRCGARSDEEAETLCIPDGDDCPGNLLFDPELSGHSPPPAGQPDGVEALLREFPLLDDAGLDELASAQRAEGDNTK